VLALRAALPFFTLKRKLLRVRHRDWTFSRFIHGLLRMALQWQSRQRISLSYAKHALNRSWTSGSGWQHGLGNTTWMSTYVLYIPSIAASPTLAALPNVHGESPGRTGVRMPAQMTCILTFSAEEEQQLGVATSIPWSEIGVESK
jgi:hypothetical protein